MGETKLSSRLLPGSSLYPRAQGTASFLLPQAQPRSTEQREEGDISSKELLQALCVSILRAMRWLLCSPHWSSFTRAVHIPGGSTPILQHDPGEQMTSWPTHHVCQTASLTPEFHTTTVPMCTCRQPALPPHLFIPIRTFSQW